MVYSRKYEDFPGEIGVHYALLKQWPKLNEKRFPLFLRVNQTLSTAS